VKRRLAAARATPCAQQPQPLCRSIRKMASAAQRSSSDADASTPATDDPFSTSPPLHHELSLTSQMWDTGPMMATAAAERATSSPTPSSSPAAVSSAHQSRHMQQSASLPVTHQEQEDSWHHFLQAADLEPVVAPTPLPPPEVLRAALTPAGVPWATRSPWQHNNSSGGGGGAHVTSSHHSQAAAAAHRRWRSAASLGGRRSGGAGSFLKWLLAMIKRALAAVIPSSSGWLLLIGVALLVGPGGKLVRSSRSSLRAAWTFMSVVTSTI